MMLEIGDLCVALAGRQVLHSISLTAQQGQITAIVGPNGSGKTTLLRAMTGDAPFHGHARLNGLDVAQAKLWQLATIRAVLAQATQLAFPFTVTEVVRLGLQSSEVDAQTDLPARALAMVGLASYGNRAFQDLSGGEQQRAHLARVLLQVWQPVGPNGPRWLFLDEPVSSLDIGHQLMVMGIARRFADAGGGVVAVMHDLNLTAMFADQMALLHNGRLAAMGSPHQVMTDGTLSTAYGCPVRVNAAPDHGPWLVPQAMPA
jgi:iron complex transport system ATP-binding protein